MSNCSRWYEQPCHDLVGDVLHVALDRPPSNPDRIVIGRIVAAADEPQVLIVKAISIHERRPQQVTTNVCGWIDAIDADDRDPRLLAG
jgi:hypothetical protein